jgi:large subunit ribosomal protein L19
MSTVIESIEQRVIKQRPRFAAGDRVRVHFQVVEGTRKRTQVFEGIVLKRQGSGARETFTVRKNSFGVGVERTFPLHSPKIEQLEVAAHGDVRRAKLYYLREKVGRRARVAERRWGIEDDMVIAAEEAEAVDAEGVAVEEAEPELVEPEEETEGEGGEAEGGGDEAKGEGGEAEGGESESSQGEGGEQPPAEAETEDEPAEGADAPPAEDADAPPVGEEQPEGEAEREAEADKARFKTS